MSVPLLLLHGFTGSPASWQPALSEMPGVRSERPALLGHDGSEGDPEIAGFVDEVDRVAAEAGGAGLRAAHVAGYSLGARIALGLLVRHPALASAATLIGVHPGLSTEPQRAERRRSDESWCRLLETRGIEAFADAWQQQPLFASQQGLPAERLSEQRRVRLGHNPRGLARSLRTVGLACMPDLRPALGGVSCRVRLLAGGSDAKFRALAEEVASALPRAAVTVADGAGHNLLLERPDFVAGALREGISA